MYVVIFKFGKYFLGVERDTFNTNYLLRQFVSTVLALGRKNLDLDDILFEVGVNNFWFNWRSNKPR